MRSLEYSPKEARVHTVRQFRKRIEIRNLWPSFTSGPFRGPIVRWPKARDRSWSRPIEWTV